MENGPPESTSLRVMVVEDEPVMNELVSEILRFNDFEPQNVLTGEEALRTCHESPPDAVLLDIMLPGISGYEVCHQLKCTRDNNLLPIVMLTALDRRDDRVRGIRVGADAYVTKPFDPVVLIEVLGKTIERVHSRMANGLCGYLELSFQSDVSYLMEVNDLLLGLYAQSPLSDKEIQEIRYCLLEIGKNAIEWGNHNQKDLLIHMEYALSRQSLEFTIRDEGEGFNPADLPHAAAADDPLAHTFVREKLGMREGGFGILLSQNFMDAVSYNPKGNEVTLVKRFTEIPDGDD
jgi:DNA-binding response OmpR family regulator